MRVSGLQFLVSNDIQKNYEAISRGIQKAAQQRSDILLVPEGGLSGYTHQFVQEDVESALDRLCREAASAKVALALSTCYYEKDGHCYNQIRIYDKEGNYKGFHAKILRCGNPEDLTQGEKTVYSTVPLQTFELENVRFGCLICNDLWANPEWTEEGDLHLTRQLSRMGAKFILHAVNSGAVSNAYMQTVQQYHESNLAIRARADRLYIVTVNSSYDTHACSSSSGMISPENGFTLKVPGTGERLFTVDLPV